MLKKYLLFVVSIVVISFFVIGCSSSTSAERGKTKSFGEVEDNLDPASNTQKVEEVTIEQITTTEKKEVFYTVQLGAFERIGNVERFEKLIKSKFPLEVKTEYDESSGYYKVSVGKYASKEEAYNLRDFCVQNGYKDAWVTEYK